MEDPIVNISCEGEEVPIQRSVLEQIYFGILKGIKQEAFKTKPCAGAGLTADDEKLPQTGTRNKTHGKHLTLAEKQVALEQVRHAIQVGTAEFDTSELDTTGRVRIKILPKRFWN